MRERGDRRERERGAKFTLVPKLTSISVPPTTDFSSQRLMKIYEDSCNQSTLQFLNVIHSLAFDSVYIWIWLVHKRNYWIIFKSLFLPRVAEFIYIEGANKRVSSARIINFIFFFVINKIYNSSRRHTHLLSPSITNYQFKNAEKIETVMRL